MTCVARRSNRFSPPVTRRWCGFRRLLLRRRGVRVRCARRRRDRSPARCTPQPCATASANPAARSPSWSVTVSSKSASPMPFGSHLAKRGGIMRFSSGFRAALVALFTLAGAGVSSAAYADGGTIWIEELKGGLVHRRIRRQRHADLPRGLAPSADDRGLERRASLWRFGDADWGGHVSNIRYPSDVVVRLVVSAFSRYRQRRGDRAS